jgi:alpha-beta hydrolase superfamily lysophospholipase
MDLPDASILEPTSPDQARRVRRRRRWLIFLASLVPLWLLGSLIVAHRLTHRSRPRADEPIPRVAWANFEPLRLATTDGHDLGAWFAPGRDDRPSVVLLHGNGGNRTSLLETAKLLTEEGCSVLPVTLRAHGDSSGDFNDFGYSARLDVVAAVAYLERRRPGRPIVLHGVSLGAAAAAFAARDLGPRVAGYVLEAPYRDLRSAVRNRTRFELPPGLEWIAYQGLVIVSPLVLPDIDAISPLDAIAHVPAQAPVLLLAGRHDPKATPEQVEAVFDRVRSHGQLVVFETAGHLHYQEADPELYRSSVLGFLRESGR